MKTSTLRASQIIEFIWTHEKEMKYRINDKLLRKYGRNEEEIITILLSQFKQLQVDQFTSWSICSFLTKISRVFDLALQVFSALRLRSLFFQYQPVTCSFFFLGTHTKSMSSPDMSHACSNDGKNNHRKEYPQHPYPWASHNVMPLPTQPTNSAIKHSGDLNLFPIVSAYLPVSQDGRGRGGAGAEGVDMG